MTYFCCISGVLLVYLWCTSVANGAEPVLGPLKPGIQNSQIPKNPEKQSLVEHKEQLTLRPQMRLKPKHHAGFRAMRYGLFFGICNSN